MNTYEQLESEKYFDDSLERKEKRQRALRSVSDAMWSMAAFFSLTIAVIGLVLVHHNPQGMVDLFEAAKLSIGI